MLTFVHARAEEADALTALCHTAAKASRGSGWNEHYPNRDILTRDIEAGTLYKIQKDGADVGLLGIGPVDPDMNSLAWELPAENPCEFSRFCLSPSVQGQGLAQPAMEAGFDYARTRGFDAVRILVFAGHTQALSLYERIGYRILGKVHLWDTDFCFCEYKL